jgi:hypothetical protein
MNVELLTSDVCKIKQEIFDITKDIEKKFNLSQNQLNALILPYHRITFSSGSMIDTPRPKAKLETIIKHVRKVTKRKEWKNNQITSVVKI